MARQYDQASDMWSFGCILYELLKFTITQESSKKKLFPEGRYLF